MTKFKPEVLELIEKDPELFAKVCEALDLKPGSMPNTLKRNGATLNQYFIVMLVAEHMGKQPEELLDGENSEEVDKVNVAQK